MTIITRERIELFVKNPLENGLTRGEQMELGRIALASLDAEPVGEVSDKRHGLVMDGTVDLGGKSTYRIIKGEKAMKRLPLGTKFYIAPPAPVVPDGLRQALSNAGIAAPESDEMLAATCEKYIQMLVTWVKDRKPFQPVPVVPEKMSKHALFEVAIARFSKMNEGFPIKRFKADWVISWMLENFPPVAQKQGDN